MDGLSSTRPSWVLPTLQGSLILEIYARLGTPVDPHTLQGKWIPVPWNWEKYSTTNTGEITIHPVILEKLTKCLMKWLYLTQRNNVINRVNKEVAQWEGLFVCLFGFFFKETWEIFGKTVKDLTFVCIFLLILKYMNGQIGEGEPLSTVHCS